MNLLPNLKERPIHLFSFQLLLIKFNLVPFRTMHIYIQELSYY